MKRPIRPADKAAKALALRIAMAGHARMSVADRVKLVAPMQASVDAIAQGRSTTGDWRNVFDALNMVEDLCRAGQATRWQEWHSALQDAIAAALDRRQEQGIHALRADELAHLRELVDMWAELLARISVRELSAAQRRVHEAGRRALAMRPEGVRVFKAVD